MGIRWRAGIESVGGNMPEARRTEVESLIDSWADLVESQLGDIGLHRTASPLFRPSNTWVIEDAERVCFVMTTLGGGISGRMWVDQTGQMVPLPALVAEIAREHAQQASVAVMLPKPEAAHRKAELVAAATRHVGEVERAVRLSRLGDLTGLEYLEPALREFLDDHPDPERNVFIMMRFMNTPQHREIHRALRSAFSAHGYNALRVDDREYTDGLWSNIEVYLTGCKLGVAVYEEIEERQFNPNVSLELGYMIAKQKRCLMLKEKRVAALHADVNYRLYKPFDSYNITETIIAQVDKWISDLPRLAP